MNTREALLGAQVLAAERRLRIEYSGHRRLLDGLWHKHTFESLALARRIVLHEFLGLKSFHDPLLQDYKSSLVIVEMFLTYLSIRVRAHAMHVRPGSFIAIRLHIFLLEITDEHERR